MTTETAGPWSGCQGPKLSYEIGDRCWIYIGEKECETDNPRLTGGFVVASFTLPNDPTTFYIIRVDDPEWMHLEVRDALLMSPDQSGVLGAMVLSAYQKNTGLSEVDYVIRDQRH